MAVYKRYKGKKISSKHPAYATARWWVYKRIRGHGTIHQGVPEARTREEAELVERKLVKQLFDKAYGVTDIITTFEDFVESTYRKYVEQNNVNKGAKKLYIKLLLKHFRSKALHTITPQDCRDCRSKLQYGRNQRKKKSTLSPSSINRIMSTLSKIFSLACEEGILDRNPMQYVKALPEPPARKRLLTPAQKEAFWKELESDTLLYRLVQLAVNMPLRRGQLLALQENVVDFENQRVWVISSKGRPPRPVPINSTAASVLREMIADKQLPFPITNFRKRWSAILIRAKINKPGGTREENYHFHDLRTYFASELIRRNINPVVVQNLFAHSDMSITNIYAETDADLMLEAVKQLDEPNAEAS
ncbi:MAG TPA: tyrosine-type recombinase/integrase [Pyrinomonadaceae bacterium]|nr:tyrosine-type recombinase/integrase [Pyrinomonadaceae bacterium]HMP66285.1 tyrosine-type recombinase/integrase [Pyrinomonadaceae bacterium]